MALARYRMIYSTNYIDVSGGFFNHFSVICMLTVSVESVDNFFHYRYLSMTILYLIQIALHFTNKRGTVLRLVVKPSSDST